MLKNVSKIPRLLEFVHVFDYDDSNRRISKGNRMGKNKKKKESFKEVVGNNFYILKLVYEACPWRVICQFIATVVRYSIMYMFIHIIFLEKLVSCVETGAPFEEAVRFLVFAFFFMSAGFCFFCYYSNVTGPMGNQIMYERLHLRMFEKATDVELECFENP